MTSNGDLKYIPNNRFGNLDPGESVQSDFSYTVADETGQTLDVDRTITIRRPEAPRVERIDLLTDVPTTGPSNKTEYTFAARFSAPVKNVDTDDFSLQWENYTNDHFEIASVEAVGNDPVSDTHKVTVKVTGEVENGGLESIVGLKIKEEQASINGVYGKPLDLSAYENGSFSGENFDEVDTRPPAVAIVRPDDGEKIPVNVAPEPDADDFSGPIEITPGELNPSDP